MKLVSSSAIKIVYAFLIILIVSCEQKPQPENSNSITEKEALDFIARYDSAWNSKDSATVSQLLGGNYVYFNSLGGLTPREKTLTDLAAPYYKVLAARREELQVVIHENVATISSRWIGNGIWKDGTFNDNQRCGLTLAKNNGKIELIAEHCVEIKAEGGAE
jgi:hypothetical protein